MSDEAKPPAEVPDGVDWWTESDWFPDGHDVGALEDHAAGFGADGPEGASGFSDWPDDDPEPPDDD